MKTFLKFMLIISVFNYSNECNSQNSEQESVSVTLDLKTNTSVRNELSRSNRLCL